MNPRTKRLLPFYIIIVLIGFFLLFNFFWTVKLDQRSPLIETISVQNTTFFIFLFFTGLTGYVIDTRFESFEKANQEKRELVKEFTKFKKIITLLVIISTSILFSSIFLGEILLLFLGLNLLTYVFIMLEYLGIGLFILELILVLKRFGLRA
ncbi:MAG: hypothetical protein ACFFDF_01560 [Candidatus Odinarchaeota archaeon]